MISLIKVKTLKDLEKIKQNSSLPEMYKNEIIKYFHQLHMALGNGKPIENFSLDQHGYIVILEKCDDVRNLKNIGLSEGLLFSCPEYIDRIKLSDFSVYKIHIMYDNEYMMTLYSRTGIHDKEVESWLAEESEDVQATYDDVPF